MMLTEGVSRPTPASSSESAALLDRLEIWDTPVTHRSLLALYQKWRDGRYALHFVMFSFESMQTSFLLCAVADLGSR
jgi:hypothetical protein